MGDLYYEPDPMDPYEAEIRDARSFWTCKACDSQNSRLDGDCQYCECPGSGCRRDSCDDPRHFYIYEVEDWLAYACGVVFSRRNIPWADLPDDAFAVREGR